MKLHTSIMCTGHETITSWEQNTNAFLSGKYMMLADFL